ncbi:DUF2062 domain-containing protein [Candidatus Magnetominusculus xianensis]|uniref:DUF2062 domain-containing protein n=1 Tax=Candidatus Magnetominusculus xianensis TaxID=1748249 RepID=A0ABR5SL12_9BACT|nr:DUF2062 domain-containing protein [Candidatus Magnetominusculus xianensis]KWT95144.1 hypothetical protein ASN18_0072 [Candidatus Magnetominusculus xianensis]MBF0402791.1 DUF2062 domain-containing protein [Nitrospirota bacterium]
MSISKLKEMLSCLMGRNDTPAVMAASIGIGILIGMSPLFGIHTFIGIFAAWAFKLNKPATITAAYITNPLTTVPIYTFSTWVGIKLMGLKLTLLDLDLAHLTFSNVIHQLGDFLLPFFIGSTVVAIISGVFSYYIMLYVYRYKNRKKPRETMA